MHYLVFISLADETSIEERIEASTRREAAQIALRDSLTSADADALETVEVSEA